MNFTKVFSLFALLVLAVLSVSAVSANQISFDNFDNSLNLPTGWTVNPSTGIGIWSVVAGNSQSTPNHFETFPASASGSGSITNTADFSISTSTFQTIILTYDRQLGETNTGDGLDVGDSFRVLWSSDGIVFTSITAEEIIPVAGSPIQQIIYQTGRTFTFPSTISNNPNFKLRFECKTSNQNEFCRIDNVNISGTAIPPTSTNLSISVAGTQPFAVGQNVTLNIANPNGLTVTMSEIGSTLFGVTFSPTAFSATTQSVQAMLSNLQNLKFGTNTVNVQASAGTQTATANFQVRKTFCSAVPLVANLSIKSIDVSNDGEGDENEWELLDEIDVELEIDNNDQDEDIDVIVELGLFDNDGKNIADDLDFTSDSDSDNEEIELSIDEDDSATVNFKFRVPADFDTGNYRLAFKVYDDDAGESKSCRDVSSDLDEGFFESIDIKEASDEGRFVVVDEFNIDSQVVCGSTLSGQFTIFNVGEEDQDRVNVIIKNNELNINEEVEFTSDLDKGDEETLSFSVIIPSTASNGIKNLEFITEYDYKNGVYREDADESSVFPIEIIGCSQNLGNTGSVSGLTNTNIEAELSSDAIAGQELIVTSTITNTGTASKSYTIDSIGYSEWAELTDISDESFSLDAGESQEIVFKFLVNEDSSGNQAFDIQLSSEGKVQVQEVEVELAEASKGFSLNLKGNSTLWIIGLVNVALILLIIVVAVRLSRK